MHTKPPRGQRSTNKEVFTYLETLRSRLIDLDATAHAAGQLLGDQPYLKTADVDARRNVGRLHALVNATAATAREILSECEELIARAYEDAEAEDLDPGDDDPDDPDDGPGGAAPGGAAPGGAVSGGDSPGGSSPGNGSKLTACPALGIPRARGSRGGIALDLAPVPPVAR